MKIVLTCGHPRSGFEKVHELLVGAGLVEAQPSRREGLSAAVYHDQLSKAQGVDPASPGPVVQVDPGKMWGDLAADLVLGNLHHDFWGWADSRLPWLLDFWSEFDPQVRFVFAYGAPAAAAVQRLHEGGATAAAVREEIASWVAVQSALLRFYHGHRDRCLLVNVEAVVRAPEEFLTQANAQFALRLGWRGTSSAVADHPISPLLAMVLKPFVDDDPAVNTLLAELEATANLTTGENPAPEVDVADAVAEYAALLTGVEELQRELARVTSCLNETESLLHQAAARGDALRLELGASQTALASAEAAVAEQQARNVQQAGEGELLMLQLHQVQEELEHYCLQVQELQHPPQGFQRPEAGAPPGAVLGVTPSRCLPVSVDLRNAIDGMNWYAAEPDGRWAGPDEVSSLTVSGVGEGHFELQLDVVDAMAPEILTGMAVSCNGRPIAVAVHRQGRKRYPVLVTGRFGVDGASAWAPLKFEFRFPRLVSPAERGSNDARRLAIRLGSLRIAAAGPTDPADAGRSLWRRVWPAGHGRAATGGGAALSRSAVMPLPEALLDLRNAIEGTNWYPAEPDGRWAGPAEVSSLTVPGLGEGRFELQLDVVDAMTPEILEGLAISRNGRPIPVAVSKPGYPALVVGRFDVDAPGAGSAWKFEMRFPGLVSPVEWGSDDTRRLAIRLRSLRVAAVDPRAESGWRRLLPKPRGRASGSFRG